MKELIFNKRFYIGLILFSVVFFYHSRIQLWAYPYLGPRVTEKNIILGEQYKKSYNVDNSAMHFSLANISIGQTKIVGDQFFARNVVTLLGSLKNLISIDILDLIDNTQKKRLVFNHHIVQLEKYIDEADSIIQQILEIETEKQSISDDCNTNKISSDNSFHEGLQNTDEQLMLESLTESKDHGVCYITNKVDANAYGAMRKTLLIYRDIAEKKLTVLETHEQFLDTDTNVFKDGTLDELIKLRENFEKYNKELDTIRKSIE